MGARVDLNILSKYIQLNNPSKTMKSGYVIYESWKETPDGLRFKGDLFNVEAYLREFMPEVSFEDTQWGKIRAQYYQTQPKVVNESINYIQC